MTEETAAAAGTVVCVNVAEDDGDSAYITMGVKRLAEEEDDDTDLVEDDAKRLRIELSEDGEQQEIEDDSIIDTTTHDHHVLNEVSVQEAGDLEASTLVHADQEVDNTLPDGIILEEEVVREQQAAPQYQNLIIQHMDIAEPLSTLKQLLEMRLQCTLSDHQFFLQDSIPLDTEKSLVDQCVQGEGMVQINLEVKSQPGMTPKINILDILKPAEEVEAKAWNEQSVSTAVSTPAQTQSPTKVVIPLSDKTENISRWVVDQAFRKEQERLKIPFDPVQWTELHVQHWLQWAVREFNLENVDIENFKMTGKQLCEIEYPQFIQYIHNDKDDIVWTHLELLRKCKFVAVMQQPTPHAVTTITVSTTDNQGRKQWKNKSRSPRITGDHGFSPGNRTGNNGQIQLWQFLLELLTDKDCREVIHWLGDEGEFKLNNPEMVAQLWGQRKNKPTMNYEKLSRALRYYYDGDMIAKVHGKRFVYKFVCDLKMLLGYTAGELNRQVFMCAEKKLQQVRETLRPSTSKHPLLDTTKMVQTLE